MMSFYLSMVRILCEVCFVKLYFFVYSSVSKITSTFQTALGAKQFIFLSAAALFSLSI